MKRIFETIDPWKIVQTSLDNADNCPAESVTSMGNGYMGARGNYEEHYSATTLKGTYIAGVWVPDVTRVGWWKNGYPRYFGKVINAPDFLSFDLYLNGERFDLAKADVKMFYREVDMHTGIMTRTVVLNTKWGELELRSTRFFSCQRKEIACMRYAVKSNGFQGTVRVETGISADVYNTDANYGEQFWRVLDASCEQPEVQLTARTHENVFGIERFTVCITAFTQGGQCSRQKSEDGKTVSQVFEKQLVPGGDALALEKYVSVVTSRDHAPQQLSSCGLDLLREAVQAGMQTLEEEQRSVWAARWQMCDVAIEGDDAAQQGIRFNLFQLLCTYDGSDARLNIGPKGFTGEKYGGAAYYDTEGYCFPLYLAVAGPEVARSLLMFRYNTLEKARENAAKLGVGGALYPMVTFNGEECHNEWEITFEELHRNAAIVYAIYCYTQYTGDESYLKEYGYKVALEVARFWVSRSTYNAHKDCYMLLGVTAPNEYENNINNNWLTNYMAKWCIEYALYSTELAGVRLEQAEREKMREVAQKMYLKEDAERGVFVQQDGFFDKDLRPVSDIPADELPICKHWSWDRILRSCYIKQADVVLAFYYFPHRFTQQQKRTNFDFYEPMTVHESSLSPSMYSVVASASGRYQEAYRLYQRAARLDLDNFNADTEDGLHITSMAGSWLAVVQGFAGLNYHGEHLAFTPRCPEAWRRVSFRILYRGRLLAVSFDSAQFCLDILEGDALTVEVDGKAYCCKQSISVPVSND